MSAVYDVVPPASSPVPLLVSIPHTGTEVPRSVAARFASPTVAELPDTDRHLHVLYDFAPELGATSLVARFSRYVVDLNRPTDGSPLYPGRSETGVVPLTTFGGEPIYSAGDEPPATEVAERVARYWEPYHGRLVSELARLGERFGYALLFDAHSITSEVPHIVPGRLPGFMLGSSDRTSAAQAVSEPVLAALRGSGVSTNENEPFKGGYITRRYGQPGESVHALQLEMSQRLYMHERPPYDYRPELAGGLRRTLRRVLEVFVDAGQRFAAAR